MFYDWGVSWGFLCRVAVDTRVVNNGADVSEWGYFVIIIYTYMADKPEDPGVKCLNIEDSRSVILIEIEVIQFFGMDY